jgi:hypothetical protein
MKSGKMKYEPAVAACYPLILRFLPRHDRPERMKSNNNKDNVEGKEWIDS